ncbi:MULTISPECIES: PucR family transcriptional regulator [Virgibacillus]|uniref:PucR family transcriptional regulator n=1 Tax=Virgibacillus TaxID=84406 RepID=UPI0003889636|nr:MULTISPECIES: helix-turn-helix domain-containing protein [Virgibacillus]EQB35104.1 hypothetical protein M948_18575 [Virgibacillus sp. CM-4]
MLHQLKKIFPSLIVNDDKIKLPQQMYKWYITDNGIKIGISKNELTNRDTALLETFMTPYHAQIPVPSDKELQWKEVIDQTSSMTHQTASSPFRFVYFSMNEQQIEPITFKESIQALFNYKIPILWENEQEGILIEEQSSITGENIPYEQIIDVIMSDLYVNIHFFVGPYLNQYQEAKSQYLTMFRYAPIALTYSDKPVTNYQEAIPYILLEQVGSPFRNELANTILQEFTADTELLQTIQMFLKCNLNVSVTAKELYMHRNSLQYRLDKFIEKTGIDIRQFHQAVTVYLALLANMHKD